MQLIFFSILVLWGINASAFALFEKKLEVYTCNSEIEAVACTSCKKERGTTFQFKVNVTSNVVLLQIYEDGKIYNTSTLSSCKVVNEKNWDCSERNTHNNGSYNSTKAKMNNGTYSHSYESLSFGVKSLNIPSSQTKSHMCAK